MQPITTLSVVDNEKQYIQHVKPKDNMLQIQDLKQILTVTDNFSFVCGVGGDEGQTAQYTNFKINFKFFTLHHRHLAILKKYLKYLWYLLNLLIFIDDKLTKIIILWRSQSPNSPCYNTSSLSCGNTWDTFFNKYSPYVPLN